MIGSLVERLQRARIFLTQELWSAEPEKPSELGVVRALQFSIMVGEGFVRDQLMLRASALTYFTVLSIVPVLAIVSSIVTAIGVTENVLGPFFDAIREVAPDVADKLQEFVQSANIGALGSVGAATLFLTTVLGISNVERSLNHIWGVSQDRRWGRRLPDYLAVLIVAPLLLGAGLSAAASVKSQWIVQQLLEFPFFEVAWETGLRHVPMALMGGAFAFLYWFLPNTHVRALAAILGGLVAAVGVNAALALYVGLSVGAARASVLYGTFAQLPLFFIWTYLFWAIVLFGAEIAFAYQNLSIYRREVRGAVPGPAEREQIGLSIAVEVARRFRDGLPAAEAEALSEQLTAPVRAVRDVAAQLVANGILSARMLDDGAEGLQLGRPAERVQVADILAALRGDRGDAQGDARLGGLVESVLSELDETASKGAGGRTLAELLAVLVSARDA